VARLSRYGRSGSGNPSPIVLALVFVLGIVLLVLGGMQTASAISAEAGHGTAGYFVAQSWHCGRSGCYWSGEFELSGGVVVRSDVEFYGSDPGMVAGGVVPAVDSGDPFGVYQPHGSDLWTHSGSFLFAGFLSLVVAALMARRLRSGRLAGPSIEAAGQPESWLG
jgi:hypothetical protein